MSVQKSVKVRQKIFRGEVDVIIPNINNGIPIDAAVVIKKRVFIKKFWRTSIDIKLWLFYLISHSSSFYLVLNVSFSYSLPKDDSNPYILC